MGRLHSRERIFEDDAVHRIYAEQGSGGEIDIGERLGPRGLMAIHDELEVLPQSGFIENEVNVCPLGV